MSEHLLLVEDDEKLASLLHELLQGYGWTVSICGSGEEALARLPEIQPDLVLLDVMLPGIDGIEVCRRIRELMPMKILMLTALGSDADQILGLEVGADDYLVKTAPPRLLLARIRALLRRGVVAAVAEHHLDLGWCRIEMQQQRVWLVDAASAPSPASAKLSEVLLTAAEFEVLALLAQDAGSVVPRETLFVDLFHRPYDSTDRTLDRRIVRLRKSLRDTDGRCIRTVRGVGYLAITERSESVC
jgi:two-component system response regulator RstA